MLDLSSTKNKGVLHQLVCQSGQLQLIKIEQKNDMLERCKNEKEKTINMYRQDPLSEFAIVIVHQDRLW